MAKNKMRPVHPGEILREDFLLPLGITAHALSKALHVTPARINDIVKERRGITADTALRLSRYFGGDPESWLNLQQTYDLKVASKLAMQQIIDEIEPRAPHADPRDALAA
ncbi:HigA family addiction module antidote protein [Oxalobacteraceae bacterium]|nr:HigA family addiction module antidote protein [Oxalobacteraceae bacterium]